MATQQTVRVDKGLRGTGMHTLRMVIDAVQHCNLRCRYCHPGDVWKERHLPASKVASTFEAAERYGVLEVVLSGGEMTMHPELDAILEATHTLKQAGSVLITNATLITEDVLRHLANSNLTRICVSVDGPDGETHNTARGKTFARVMDGLEQLQTCGKPLTVISVAHQANFRRLLELSYLLADRGLAQQHHLCAPSYSGTARQYYGRLRLDLEDYFTLQGQVDDAHVDLRARGLFLTFNSFWPATGRRSSVDSGRTITLQQLVEQTKDTLVHVRPDGNLRLATASWGRETVGKAAIGNILREEADELLDRADQLYEEGKMMQLTREVEALHKFQIGAGADRATTNSIIDSDADPTSLAQMVPITPMSNMTLLHNPIGIPQLAAVAGEITSKPTDYRIAMHASGVHVIYCRPQSHVTLLADHEWPKLAQMLTSNIGGKNNVD